MSSSILLRLTSCMIFMFIYFANTPATCSSNETDRLALLNFKAMIDLDPLGSLTSWNRTSQFCLWNGIQCGRLHRDRVVAINLPSQGLVGSLSPHIGNLSFIRTLNLGNNSFHGQIPQEVGRLRRVETIDLSHNAFLGSVPSNLSQCSNLVNLNLMYNSLSGSIPPEIGSLNKLEVLFFLTNNLSGNIPPSIGNLTSLRRLSLSRCALDGDIPQSLVNLRHLSHFNLGVNRLTGTVPAGLFNISTIDLFAVHANQLEGEIPSRLGLTLPNLEGLYLGGNRFTGTIPASLSNASSLEVIVLLMNNFTGPIPKVGGLLNLQIFTVALNQLQDDISFIASLTNCTNLQLLNIGDNFLTGSLPDSTGNLSINLESLAIPNTQIHGRIPSSIRNLVGLTSLALFNNFHDGSIPSDIGNLYNLHEIYMGGNELTSELPPSFNNLTRLIILSLPSNNFFGSIQSLSSCTDLLNLDLSYNNFSGLIPPEIMSLQSISIALDLSYNAFVGSIPSEVGSLSNLVSLNLSNNRLSGLVPNTISQCTSLEYLQLEGNTLEGEIPPGLGGLLGLQELDLSRNKFYGRLPSFLSNLHLEKLNLSYNRLQGEVPIQGVFRNMTADSLVGNKELCGGILVHALPSCPLLDSPSNRLSNLLKKILIPSVGIAFLVFLGFITFVYKRKKHIKDFSLMPSLASQFIRLSYADLVRATDGFCGNNLIGKGRFGSVYRGILKDGQTLVAVKVLNLSVAGASKSFIAECNALRGLRHKNLVKILSACESIDFNGNGFMALIYEFKVNGSLEKWLCCNMEHGAECKELNMFQRLKIAIDVARALEYLHHGTESCVVHCDLKPSNILLDHDLNAYIGDFGLAKIVSSMMPAYESSSSVLIKGTIGYVAPEYATSYTVSMQGDVYSYGILLLEMFTNIRPTDERFKDDANLHSVVNDVLPDHVLAIMDPSIQKEHERNSKIKDSTISILRIGVGCSRTVPKDRMLLADVVNDLCKLRDLYEGSS